jgi:hypothetical protein
MAVLIGFDKGRPVLPLGSTSVKEAAGCTA